MMKIETHWIREREKHSIWFNGTDFGALERMEWLINGQARDIIHCTALESRHGIWDGAITIPGIRCLIALCSQ